MCIKDGKDTKTKSSCRLSANKGREKSVLIFQKDRFYVVSDFILLSYTRSKRVALREYFHLACQDLRHLQEKE